MSNALLTILQWCLLALLYLFFFRVVQVTWVGLSRATATEATPDRRAVFSRRASSRAKLVVLEPVSQAGDSYPIGDELTVGRAAGCGVTLDDTYVSQMHAQLRATETGVVLNDLGSTNGTYLNRQRVTAPVAVNNGDKIQVGSTVMELR